MTQVNQILNRVAIVVFFALIFVSPFVYDLSGK